MYGCWSDAYATVNGGCFTVSFCHLFSLFAKWVAAAGEWMLLEHRFGCK